jgi:invasion protein IalB
MQSEKSVSWLLAGAVLLALSSAATAQQPPNEVPQRTTATYANWVLTWTHRLGRRHGRFARSCRWCKPKRRQGRTTPFSSIAIMHPVKGQPIKLVIQVPTNVTLSTNVHIQTADADPGVAAPFARCAPSGCFVDFELKDDMVKKFRAASGNGKITYADVTGHEVAVPLSFSGFDQALEALAKE